MAFKLFFSLQAYNDYIGIDLNMELIWSLVINWLTVCLCDIILSLTGIWHEGQNCNSSL